MDFIDSIILGIIQGLTEFLPVSSSGHLELGKAILGDQSVPKESLLFTVVLHFATALSTIVVFRKDIWSILKGILKFEWNDDLQFASKIAISMIPAVIIASQGYSVLYLFLIADMVCCAILFPVFFGLYSSKFNGNDAVISMITGLIIGTLLFPNPDLVTFEWFK